MQWLRKENEERISYSLNHETGATNLTIQDVTRNDTGIYTCQKSEILEHFNLNVIGEHMAIYTVSLHVCILIVLLLCESLFIHVV